MNQKQNFIQLALSDRYSITELCENHGISRKTGHKWLKRFEQFGEAGLSEMSRAPKTAPRRTPDFIQRLIVAERERHSTWGPKKIRQRLKVVHGIEKPPAVSTVGEILKRHGLVRSRRRRGCFDVARGALTKAQRPNHVFGVDFKGWFRIGNDERCDPLTISDLFSRFIIRIDALPGQFLKPTKKSFESAFQRYGLPEIIRVDNGAPFASMGPGGLSQLSVWWMSLGIRVEFSRPGCPQDNGCHERMHRTMKAECCGKKSRTMSGQQQRMNRWRQEFNEERPHEAIGLRVPADVYQSSSRRLNREIKSNLYELGVKTKPVSQSGFISWAGNACFVGEAFRGQEVALERCKKSGLMLVRYGNVQLGSLRSKPGARLQPTASDGPQVLDSCNDSNNHSD